LNKFIQIQISVRKNLQSLEVKIEVPSRPIDYKGLSLFCRASSPLSKNDPSLLRFCEKAYRSINIQ